MELEEVAAGDKKEEQTKDEDKNANGEESELDGEDEEKGRGEKVLRWVRTVGGSSKMAKERKERREKQGRQPGERKDFHMKLYKTPKETMVAIAIASEKKMLLTVDKYFTLAILAGVYIAFGGIFAIAVGKNMPNSDPGVAKLLFGITFSLGLILIVQQGAELVTGTVMFLTVGILNNNISVKSMIYSLLTSYFGNMTGTLAAAYFFGYLTELFSAAPYEAAVQGIAESKVALGWGVVLLRAIPCNWMVTSATFVATASEDVASKILGILFPITAFVAIGYEHCVANMFFVPLGIMYGADVTWGEYIYGSLIPSTIGNAIGGGIFMGGIIWFAYGFGEEGTASANPFVDVKIFKCACFNWFWTKYKMEKT